MNIAKFELLDLNNKKSLNRLKSIIATTSIIILSGIYQLLFYDYGINMLDEGFLLTGAERTLNGEIAILDFFGYSPGSYIYISLFFKLLGISIHSARIAMIFITSATLTLLYFTSRYLMPFPFSIFPSLMLLLAPSAYHARFIAFFTVLNLFIIFNYIYFRSRLCLIATALTSALALYFRKDIGCFSILTSFFIILSQNYFTPSYSKLNFSQLIKEIFFFIFLVLLPLLPVFTLLFINTAFSNELKEYFKALSGFNKNMRFLNLPDPFLYWRNKGFGTKVLFEGFFFYYPFIAYLGVALCLLINNINKSKIFYLNGYILAIFIFGIQTLTYIFHYPDIWHSLTIYPLVFLLTVYFFYKFSLHISYAVINYSILIFITLFFAIITINNYGFIFGSLGVINNDHRFLNMNKANIYVPVKKFFIIKKIVYYIKNNSKIDDYLFVVPHEAIWYFLCDRKNPTSHDVLMPGMFDKRMQMKVIGNLKKNPPKLIISQNISLNGKEETKLKNFARDIFLFIKHNYVPVKKIDEYTILLKKSFIY